jgi:hypothetical protein
VRHQLLRREAAPVEDSRVAAEHVVVGGETLSHSFDGLADAIVVFTVDEVDHDAILRERWPTDEAARDSEIGAICGSAQAETRRAARCR